MTEDEAPDPDPEPNEDEGSFPAPSDDENKLQELLSQMATIQVVVIERDAEELPIPGPGHTPPFH